MTLQTEYQYMQMQIITEYTVHHYYHRKGRLISLKTCFLDSSPLMSFPASLLILV